MKRLAIAILIVLAGCGEREEALPNGYRFIELSRGSGAITKNGNFTVYPNIVEHRVRGNLVYGKRALGSGLVDHSQKMTVAARVMAEKKAVGQRS